MPGKMIRSGLLLVFIAAGLSGVARTGETPEKPEKPKNIAKVSWLVPQEVSGGDMVPVQQWAKCYDSIALGERFLISVISPSRSMFCWGRNAAGRWVDIEKQNAVTVISKWVSTRKSVAMLYSSRKSVHLTVVSPQLAVEERVQRHTVYTAGEEDKKSDKKKRSSYNYLQSYSVALIASPDGKLLALMNLSSRNKKARTIAKLSEDCGQTWSDLCRVGTAEYDTQSVGSLTGWFSDGKWHVLMRSTKGNNVIEHKTSSDGIKWSKGPDLPKIKGQPVAWVRHRQYGGKLYLLVATLDSNSRIPWLMCSSDGGQTWDWQRICGSAVVSADQLAYGGNPYSLSVGPGMIAVGFGSCKTESVYDRSINQNKVKVKAKGGVLVSRDQGKSWVRQEFTKGLKPTIVLPTPAVLPSGELEVFFGWHGGKNRNLIMLSRRTGDDSAARKARIKLIAELIKNLADDNFRKREAAAAGLTQLKILALPALLEATKDADAERSLAASGLLRKLSPVWWKVQ
jgi:hypothetical protein